MIRHDGRQAALNAKAYLMSQRDRHGLWTDFLTYAGESVDWVSGFVALELLHGGINPNDLHVTADSLLARQRPSGGWGYNINVPEDADSTRCIILVLQNILPDARDEVESARLFLARHQLHCGFTTFLDVTRLQRYMRVGTDTDFKGWCNTEHACVTACATLALAKGGSDRGDFYLSSISRALDYLRHIQSNAGYWESYWWCTPMYATVYAIQALHLLGDSSDNDRIDAAYEWLARSQLNDGGWDSGDGESGAFVTGLALQTLIRNPLLSHTSVGGIQWLVEHQRADGSWDPCPILQIPPPGESEPKKVTAWKRGGLGVPVRIADQHRLFTTAVSFAALSLAPNENGLVDHSN